MERLVELPARVDLELVIEAFFRDQPGDAHDPQRPAEQREQLLADIEEGRQAPIVAFNDIRALRAPPLLVAVDHEGGRVQRFRTGFSVLPPARRIGMEFDVDAHRGLEMARSLAWLMAAELRALHIDFSFTPCVDLDYGVSEIIGDRAYHARAESVSRLALAVVQGMRHAGMAAFAAAAQQHVGALLVDAGIA